MIIKKVLLSSSILLIAGCGVVNNVGLIGKNVTRLFGSHPYAVKEGEEEQVLKSEKGIVDLYFTKNIGTAWMRIDENGNIDSKNYTLTYNEIGGTGRRKSQLEPGTYFLNGFIGEGIMSGYYARSIKLEAFGWDKENKKARCFSFKVKAGEVLRIPDIKYEGFSGRENDICPKLSYTETRPDNALYEIGDESK